VVDGPFAETNEAVLELRPLFEVQDFGDHATPEVRERAARLRAELGKRGN